MSIQDILRRILLFPAAFPLPAAPRSDGLPHPFPRPAPPSFSRYRLPSPLRAFDTLRPALFRSAYAGHEKIFRIGKFFSPYLFTFA